MPFRNFIQRYWFAKTELNHLAGLGCNFKDHFGQFSDKPIKMSPFDQWFIWTASHIQQIWYFKIETDRKKKKKAYQEKVLFELSGLCEWLYSMAWGGPFSLASPKHQSRKPLKSWYPGKLKTQPDQHSQYGSLTGV